MQLRQSRTCSARHQAAGYHHSTLPPAAVLTLPSPEHSVASVLTFTLRARIAWQATSVTPPRVERCSTWADFENDPFFDYVKCTCHKATDSGGDVVWCQSPRNYALLAILCTAIAICIIGIAGSSRIIARAKGRHRTAPDELARRGTRRASSSSSHHSLGTSGRRGRRQRRPEAAPPTYEVTVATPPDLPVPDNEEPWLRSRRLSSSGSLASGTCPPPLDRTAIRSPPSSGSPSSRAGHGVRLPALPASGVGPPPLPPDVVAGIASARAWPAPGALRGARESSDVTPPRSMAPPTLTPPELGPPKYSAVSVDVGMQRPSASPPNEQRGELKPSLSSLPMRRTASSNSVSPAAPSPPV